MGCTTRLLSSKHPWAVNYDHGVTPKLPRKNACHTKNMALIARVMQKSGFPCHHATKFHCATIFFGLIGMFLSLNKFDWRYTHKHS
jgi:hypothetical protein